MNSRGVERGEEVGPMAENHELTMDELRARVRAAGCIMCAGGDLRNLLPNRLPIRGLGVPGYFQGADIRPPPAEIGGSTV